MTPEEQAAYDRTLQGLLDRIRREAEPIRVALLELVVAVLRLLRIAR